jgi:hypothetical protein
MVLRAVHRTLNRNFNLIMAELDLDAIRTSIQERVKKTGLRRIARQVGMSASGLDKFLRGAVPYEKTRAKMVAWVTRLEGGDERSAEDVLIDELVSSLPEARQEKARGDIVLVLDRARRGSV